MLGTRSFAKRQILRYDHGYAVESLPVPATAAALNAAAREPTARALPAEDYAKPGHETESSSVPRWVANDRKVRGTAACRMLCLASTRGSNLVFSKQ